MSAVNNNSKAMQVILAPRLNEHLMSFMEIDDLERLKLASKKIPQAPMERVVRERVFTELTKSLSPHDYRIKDALVSRTKDPLKGVPIRNFPQPVRAPLSNYPGRCMTGFEQRAPGIFTAYTFIREDFVLKPRLPCLPDCLWARTTWFQGMRAGGPVLPERDNNYRPYKDLIQNNEEFCWRCCLIDFKYCGEPSNLPNKISSYCCRACGCCCCKGDEERNGWLDAVRENTRNPHLDQTTPGLQVLSSRDLVENISSFLQPADIAHVKQVSKQLNAGTQGPKREIMI